MRTKTMNYTMIDLHKLSRKWRLVILFILIICPKEDNFADWESLVANCKLLLGAIGIMKIMGAPNIISTVEKDGISNGIALGGVKLGPILTDADNENNYS